jgi:hypothetical protein
MFTRLDRMERRLSGNCHPTDRVTFKRFPWLETAPAGRRNGTIVSICSETLSPLRLFGTQQPPLHRLWFRQGDNRLGLTATNRDTGFGHCAIGRSCWPHLSVRPTFDRSARRQIQLPQPSLSVRPCGFRIALGTFCLLPGSLLIDVGCLDRRKPLLQLLPCRVHCRHPLACRTQLGLYGGNGLLISPCHRLQLGLRQAGMSQLSLKVVDHRLRLGQRPIRLLARHAFRGDRGLGSLEPVDRSVGSMIAAPVQHGHRDLAVLCEASPRTAGAEPLGLAWRLVPGGSLGIRPARRTVQPQCTAHLRLDILHWRCVAEGSLSGVVSFDKARRPRESSGRFGFSVTIPTFQ